MKTIIIRVRTNWKWPVVTFRYQGSNRHYTKMYGLRDRQWTKSTHMRGYDYGQEEHDPVILKALDGWLEEQQELEKRACMDFDSEDAYS